MVFIANDHGGVELKNKIVAFLKERGVEVINFGTDTTDSVDYPDYAVKAAKSVAENEGALGIVICKTGVGMSIAANKCKGIRCALCTSADMGRLCRQHNNANMLALGASNTDVATALSIVDAFLSSEFEGGRHVGRVNKIMAIEDCDVK